VKIDTIARVCVCVCVCVCALGAFTVAENFVSVSPSSRWLIDSSQFGDTKKSFCDDLECYVRKENVGHWRVCKPNLPHSIVFLRLGGQKSPRLVSALQYYVTSHGQATFSYLDRQNCTRGKHTRPGFTRSLRVAAITHICTKM